MRSDFSLKTHRCFSNLAYWLPTRDNYFTRWPIPLVTGKREQKEEVWQQPPHPPRCSYGGKTKTKKTLGAYIKENKKGRWPERASRDSSTCMPRCYAYLSPSRARTGFLRLVNRANWCRLVAGCVRSQLSQFRFLPLLLVKSSRVYLLFPPCGYKPSPTSVTVSTQSSASNAVASQSTAMLNARMSLCTQ